MAAAPPCGGHLSHLDGSPGPADGPTYNPSAMSATSVPDLILYGRADCGLCDEARTLLHALFEERRTAGRPTPAFREVDIDTDPVLQRAFFATIPVVELGERRLETVTSAARLRRLLAEVLDAERAPATS